MTLILFVSSCNKENYDNRNNNLPEKPYNPPINDPIEPPLDTTKIIPLVYTDDRGHKIKYEAVRIGEYLWMNSNFNAPLEHSITREQLDKVMQIYEINPKDFTVSNEDFNTYYGQYYSREAIEYMARFGKIYEGKSMVLRPWKIPSKADFRQLFAMCGNATERDVRVTLACKLNDNPATIVIPGTYWFSSYNSNKYGFNLMPGGARFHNPTDWKICYPSAGCKTFHGLRGDFYAFSMAALWVASDGTVSVHDYPDTSGVKLWHWLNMRWCRKLTDKELGYKLYIDNSQTDIIKLSLQERPPTGYSELPNGYIRGFYVQYNLNNDNIPKTVKEIVEMAKELK